MSDCVDSKTGQIYVNKYMQVTNVNPTNKGDTRKPPVTKTY
jgi:hypothetical protein